MEKEVGGGMGMGNTCKPMAVTFQCMTKSTTIKKKKIQWDPVIWGSPKYNNFYFQELNQFSILNIRKKSLAFSERRQKGSILKEAVSSEQLFLPILFLPTRVN